MLNRTYHLRSTKAVRKAGGGHKLGQLQGVQLELGSRNIEISQLSDFLPWGGIFEPWKPLVMVAAAAEALAITKPQIAANGCKSVTYSSHSRRQRLEAAGQIRLPDMSAQKFTPPEILYTGVKNFTRKSTANRPPKAGEFPPLAPTTEYEAERPLADLFPEAYL
jgi:hypothetical protein